ncbi:hypothetical protein PPERSA_09982 [Pseudocohnilembus persalinus]|uniref:Uncharacterized protein n=1 Tax=Pseudocohnilembus persalinus TaxID=266149 RepID=A0A0V0QJC9_PSEPJ|nr:hypothetical protein PPERSA_09982 [Pseudocohnilembus persalinus]|eukprot:KRX02365.1 hypothetical protein PPERSA_09982 [Pseudocohnilembus persalinus]
MGLVSEERIQECLNSECLQLKVFGNHIGKCEFCENQEIEKKRKLEEQEEENQKLYEKSYQNQEIGDDQFNEILEQAEFGLKQVGFQEKFQDCKCCSGMVYSCNGQACSYLGCCHCYYNYNEEQEEKNIQEQIQKKGEIIKQLDEVQYDEDGNRLDEDEDENEIEEEEEEEEEYDNYDEQYLEDQQEEQ